MKLLLIFSLFVVSTSAARSIQRYKTEINCTSGEQVQGEYVRVEWDYFEDRSVAFANSFCRICPVEPQPDKVYNVTRTDKSDFGGQTISWTGESDEGVSFSLVTTIPHLIPGPQGQLPPSVGAKGFVTIGPQEIAKEMSCTVYLK